MTYPLIAACALPAAFAPLARSVSSRRAPRRYDGTHPQTSLGHRRG